MAACGLCLLHTAGHFTQLVWKSSTMVGCAAKVCPVLTNSPFPMGTLVICRCAETSNSVCAEILEQAHKSTSFGPEERQNEPVYPSHTPAGCTGH